MPLKIDQDHSRFKQIVRGKIKANLRKYVQKGEMLGKKGKDQISIPVPFIAEQAASRRAPVGLGSLVGG